MDDNEIRAQDARLAHDAAMDRMRIKAMLVETARRSILDDAGALALERTPAKDVIAHVQPLYDWIVKP